MKPIKMRSMKDMVSRENTQYEKMLDVYPYSGERHYLMHGFDFLTNFRPVDLL